MAATMASTLVASVGALRGLSEPVGRRRRHCRLPRRLLLTCGPLRLVLHVEKWREISKKIWYLSVTETKLASSASGGNHATGVSFHHGTVWPLCPQCGAWRYAHERKCTRWFV